LTIHYPWHPWHGQQFHRIQTRKTIAGIDYFLVSRGEQSGTARLLPAWLFDAEFSRRCRIVNTPSVSLRALENLHELLMAIPYAACIIGRRRLDTGARHEESTSRHGKRVLAESFRTAAENAAPASGGRRRVDSASRASVSRRQIRSGQTGEGRA
jgi:hypothetical protein